jgi:hypothetical protein
MRRIRPELLQPGPDSTLVLNRSREKWAELGSDPWEWRDPPPEYLERDPAKLQGIQRQYLG